MKANLVVTGSSGFIGSHLCKALLEKKAAGAGRVFGLDIVPPPFPMDHAHVHADIRCPEISTKSRFGAAPVLVHLAAKGEVVMSFEHLTDLIETNVIGTLKVLEALNPERMIFASSSAVYGSSERARITPQENSIPVGAYGMSKAVAELCCREWARKKNRSVMLFRFGNVIGPRCRGIIPYLVKHALQHPDGSVPAQARGNGRLIRDYVPVDYVTKNLMAAIDSKSKPGAIVALNVGTGVPETNAAVGSIVQRVLKKQGYQLRINWDNPVDPGEPRCVVLDMKETLRRFGIPIPKRDEVVSAIEEAALSHVNRETARR